MTTVWLKILGFLDFPDAVSFGADALPEARKRFGPDCVAFGEREEHLDVPFLGERDVEDGIVLLRVPGERMKAGAVEHDPTKVVPNLGGVKRYGRVRSMSTGMTRRGQRDRKRSPCRLL
jgi:hypothetical protein